jgi:hypothetical protein
MVKDSFIYLLGNELVLEKYLVEEALQGTLHTQRTRSGPPWKKSRMIWISNIFNLSCTFEFY